MNLTMLTMALAVGLGTAAYLSAGAGESRTIRKPSK